ncbi:hypothetical protein DVH24_027593, partial [Malus domestica]
LWYRYVVDVLSDAQVYSEHACKATIDCDDVKLAIQRKVNFSFPQSPPREGLEWHCHLNRTLTEEMVEDEEPSEPNPPQEPEPSGVPQNTPQWVSFPMFRLNVMLFTSAVLLIYS